MGFLNKCQYFQLQDELVKLGIRIRTKSDYLMFSKNKMPDEL